MTDLDGNRFYDLTGSYGVNVFGYDFYKECIARGSERVRDLGPGARRLPPGDRLQRAPAAGDIGHGRGVLSHVGHRGGDASGAARPVSHAAAAAWCASAAPITAGGATCSPESAIRWRHARPIRCKDMDEAALRVLKSRRDIACVLVNPLQALHPNVAAPRDSTLLDSGRSAHFDRAAYGEWLEKLRAVCSERGIVLIFDEVFVGFRLAPGGAQEYFGVRADMVTYGKTVAGGLPIGVLCGKAGFMRRYREERPADICLARGTFNSHPYVMGAMYEFLQRLDSDAIRSLYRGLDAVWNSRAAALNERLNAAQLPVQVANLSSIWTIFYTRPSRYNWMFQYYLRAAGLALSLGRNGPPHLQPELHRRRFRRGRRQNRVGGAGHASRRLVVVRTAPDQQIHQKPRVQGDASGPMGVPMGVAHRIDELTAQQVKRRFAVEFHVVKRIRDDLRQPDEPGLHVAQIEQMHGPEQQRADADDEPYLADLPHESLAAGVGRHQPEKRRGQPAAVPARRPRRRAG